jgi:hypothetical protein
VYALTRIIHKTKQASSDFDIPASEKSALGSWTAFWAGV